jgi:hypothetical protein
MIDYNVTVSLLLLHDRVGPLFVKKKRKRIKKENSRDEG